MIFNSHYNLAGAHAFLGASKYHWINYDAEKLDRVYRNHQAAQKGSELHVFAHEAIRLGIKLPASRKTLNMYVNDAIGYRMTPEQILYYSNNCFGTADAVSFRKNLLRIHDFKSGVISASMHQLEIYTALFCLEYGMPPGTIDVELRIYQNDEVVIANPEVDDIVHIISQIIEFDKQIEQIKMEG